MLRLFKRKKVVAASRLQEKAAGWFVAKVLWLQLRWSAFMDRKVNRLSVRSKKFGLMVFVGLSVLVCVSIVIETFTVGHSRPFKIGQIKKRSMPKDLIDVGIPQQQYKRVVAFRQYMDSLAATEKGKKVFDSIMKHRPGLLDSAKVLEKLYEHQNKKQ